MRKTKSTKSFKIPHNLEIKMNKKLVADGYGLRGKSKWICDSLKAFLSEDEDFIMDCIQYVDDLENLEKTVSFRSSEEVDILLSSWLIKSRKKIPELEGVKSKIIRASILQALLSPPMKNATR
jgi:hypothetical protein